MEDDEEILGELLYLKKIIATEASPLQVKKLILCLIIVISVITMNVIQPTSNRKSPIGISLCSGVYWLVLGVFLAICCVIEVIAIRINQNEQKVKIKFKMNYQEGDILFQGRNLNILISIGFLGGLVAGALGLGGGSIYNPAFLALGVHPKVSSATGMFLVMISTINSVLIDYMNGYMLFWYACLISTFAIIGSLLGMLGTDAIVKKTGRPSFFVWLLFLIFALSAVALPIFGGM